MSGIKSSSSDIDPRASEWVGHVDVLRGTIGQDGRREGDIRLTLCREGESIEAWAHLTAEEHELAVRAHVTGQRMAMEGTLKRVFRLWVVDGVTNFRLLPTEGRDEPIADRSV